MEIDVSLPLDDDGFLRRECPTCVRQFKWLHTKGEDTARSESRVYFCPYCGELASPDKWWTREQLEYMQELAIQRVGEEILDPFASSMQKLNRPGSPVSVQVTRKHRPIPAKLVEPNDMKELVPTCHASEPVKVSESWTGVVHCLVCGQTIEP